VNQNTVGKKAKVGHKIVYSLMLSLILGPPILFAVIAFCAAQNSDVALNVSGTENVWAVVIGVCDYDDSAELHNGPINSAKLINSTLVDTFRWPRSHICLLLDEEGSEDDDATKKEIEDAVTWLAHYEDQNSTVLFYFSGHGWRNESGEPEYIVPGEARYLSEYVSDDELANMLSQLESKQTIVIIDSCDSGGFAWDGASRGDLAKDGRIILASSREDEYSYIDPIPSITEWNHRFTWYLVQGFDMGKTVEKAFQYAQEKTSQTSQLSSPQHPKMYDGVNPITLNLDAVGKELGAVTLVGAFCSVLMVVKNKRRSSASQPQTLPSAYICPVCNKNLTWIPQSQQLYCPNCQRRIN
jgi:hypothetical protein